MDKYYILTPPPNLTGLFHNGHVLNLVIQEFIKSYMKYIHEDNLDSIFGFDHAALYAEIIAKRSLNIITKENIISKILSNELIFKSNILSQLKEMGIRYYNEGKELFTFGPEAVSVTKEHFSNLMCEKLIFFQNKVCFVDTKLKTTLSDLEVKNIIVDSKLYYVRYDIHNEINKFVVVATTKPETIEDDVCLVFSDGDERYEHLFRSNVVNPITGALIPILKSKYVSKSFGTGLVKVTPSFSTTDEKIIEELNIISYNKKKIYDFSTLKFNENSLFVGNEIYKSCELAYKLLLSKNKIEKIESHKTNKFISVRGENLVIQIAIPQYFLDMSSLILKSRDKINNLNIVGCRGFSDIKQFTENLKPWCISRQNVYGHVIDNDNVLDTWFSSSLYVSIAIKTLNLSTKHTKFIVITAYDIMFFWIYRMFYNSQYFLKNQLIKYVIVHGILCDKNGVKISKSKSNAQYIRFNNIEEFERHKMFLLCHNLFAKKISIDDSKLKYVDKFIAKINHLIIFFKKYNLECNDILNVISKDTIIVYLISKLLNIFKAEKKLDVDCLLQNIEYIFGSAYKLCGFLLNDISTYLINIMNINKDISVCIRNNIAALFNLTTCFVSFLIPNIYSNIANKIGFVNKYSIVDFVSVIRQNMPHIFEYEIIKILDMIFPFIADKNYDKYFKHLIGISNSEIIKCDIKDYDIYYSLKCNNDNKLEIKIYFNEEKINESNHTKIKNILKYVKNCNILNHIKI